MEKTINRVFRNRAVKYQDRIAIEKKLRGKWEGASWSAYYDRARSTGLALVSLGIERGDRVSLLSDNRLEWLYTDMGVLGIGASVVPIYPNLTEEEVEYIVANSESRVIVVENKSQLQKAIHAKKRCPALLKVVVIEKDDAEGAPDFVLSFDSLMELGAKIHKESPALFQELSDAVTPEDVATIVYTSGTTGVPKGAMITHKNIMAVVNSLHAIEPHYGFETDQTVPFLPLCHVFERLAGHFYGMYVGLTASYAESLETIIIDIAEKKPDVILAVPRVCEKVYQRIISQVQQQPRLTQKIFYWGQKIGSRISELREQKKRIPFFTRMRYAIAYHMIFKKLKNALGGRVRWMTTAGAPTAIEIIRFFNSAGIQVVEGFGMTETCAPATMSNLADYRIGTVGRPIPNVDIKIADDGEILIKGDNVFKGYWKMEEETIDAFTPDGYLKSGDIGMFTPEGFLVITDRKKDLIITSGGKNVAPQKIENLFKSDPLFTQFTVIGDKRKYLAALVNINLEQAARIAGEKKIVFARPEDLFENTAFLEIVGNHLAKGNAHLAKHETIKKIRLIRREFSKDGGELTATLKIKRKVIQDKYTAVIESMYTENAPTVAVN